MSDHDHHSAHGPSGRVLPETRVLAACIIPFLVAAFVILYGLPGRTGWSIPPGDRAAFRAALRERREEPAADRADRAAAARIFARETFDPSRQIAAYLELFARLKSV